MQKAIDELNIGHHSGQTFKTEQKYGRIKKNYGR
jgi:hypothetical protein